MRNPSYAKVRAFEKMVNTFHDALQALVDRYIAEEIGPDQLATSVQGLIYQMEGYKQGIEEEAKHTMTASK